MFAQQIALSDQLKQNIDQMTEEFIREKGYITCELSIGEQSVVAVHQYIHEKNRELPGYGMWRVYLCETCMGHNEHAPYHVDIMVCDKRPEMHTTEEL